MTEWWAWYETYEWHLIGVIGGLYVLVLWVKIRGIRKRQQASLDTYGHAQFGTLEHAKKAGLTRGPGIVVGCLGKTYLRIPPGRHVIFVGPTRSGKTTTAISSLLGWVGSAFIYAPKISLRTHTAWARSGAPDGQKWPVHILAPGRPDSPDQLNPFDFIRWRTIYEVRDAARTARRLTTKDEIDVVTDASTYYRSGAESVLLFGLLCVQHGVSGTFLCSPSGLRQWLLSAPSRSTAFPAWLLQLTQHPHRGIADGARFLRQQPAGELPKWWAAALNWLDAWRDPILAHNTDTTTIPLADIQTGPTPMTVYIEVPAEDLKGPLGQLVKLIVEQLRTLTHEDTRPRRHRLLVVFDDMAEFDRFPLIQHSANLDAEYGWQLLLLVQSFNQLWEVLGAHASLLDNCSAWLVFCPNHPDTAELIAKKLGTTTVVDDSTRVTRQWWIGHPRVSQGVSVHERDLMTAREVQELGPDEAILFVSHQPPFRLTQARWYTHPYWRERVPAQVQHHHGD